MSATSVLLRFAASHIVAFQSARTSSERAKTCEICSRPNARSRSCLSSKVSHAPAGLARPLLLWPGPLDPGHDFPRGDAESGADPQQGADGRRLLVVFEHADIGPVELGGERQLFLRHSSGFSGLAQFASQHGERVCPPGGCMYVDYSLQLHWCRHFVD